MAQQILTETDSATIWNNGDGDAPTSDGFLLQWNSRMGVVVWGLTTRRKLSITVQIKQQSPGQPDGAVGDWKLDQRDPAALFLHPFLSFIRFYQSFSFRTFG